MGREISRRDLLKLTSVAAAGLAEAAIIDEWCYMGRLRQPIEDWLFNITKAKAEVFDPNISPRRCVNTHRAFIVVHAGYLRELRYERQWVDRGYGSYQNYLENLAGLHAYLQASGEPTVLAIEDRLYWSRNFAQDSSLPSCLSVVVTRNTFGLVKEYLSDKGRLLRQDIFSTIIEPWQKSEITTVFCAGEMAYLDEATVGCLNQMAERFAPYFNIKGVEGCVYPLKPPQHPPNEIVRKLYHDTIPIPQL